MNDQQESLGYVVGSGTYTDPYQFRSRLLRLIDHIHPVGNRVPAQIAEAREILARTDVDEETRISLEYRITDLEYQWHLGRTANLVQLAFQSYKPESTAARKREELLQQAHAAREAFYAFAAAHPAIHEKRRGEVTTVEDLVARRVARRSTD